MKGFTVSLSSLSSLSRTARLLCAAAVTAGLAASLTACSSGSDDENSGTPAGSTAASSAGTAEASFPVTFTSAFGDVRVTEKPQRVVALAWSDQAIATELGADVVLAPQSYSSMGGDGEKMVPYLDTDTEPEWLNPEKIDVEAVARQEPDIILATSAYAVDRALYEKLSAIAPVISYQERPFTTSAADSARRIGQALGEPEKAEELIKAADTAVADLISELPGLAGKSYFYGMYQQTAVGLIAGDDSNVTTRFLASIGLVPAPATDAGKPDEFGTVVISMENLDMLDNADLLIMTFQGAGDRDAFEGLDAVRRLTVMDAGYLPIDKEQASALQDPNVVAVPWLIDQLRASLEKVAG